MSEDDEMQETLLKVLQRYGFATVVALVLGYIMVVDMRADQELMKEQHRTIVEEQANLARGILKLADKGGETQMLQEKILGVLRQMCVQQAVSMAERNECLREEVRIR